MAEFALFSLLVDYLSLRSFLFWGIVDSAFRLPLFGLEAAVSAHLRRLSSLRRTSFDVLESRVALEDYQSVAFLWCFPIKGLIDHTTSC